MSGSQADVPPIGDGHSIGDLPPSEAESTIQGGFNTGTTAGVAATASTDALSTVGSTGTRPNWRVFTNNTKGILLGNYAEDFWWATGLTVRDFYDVLDKERKRLPTWSDVAASTRNRAKALAQQVDSEEISLASGAFRRSLHRLGQCVADGMITELYPWASHPSDSEETT
jgi:hypothetical protein